jgi:hypothetical protein
MSKVSGTTAVTRRPGDGVSHALRDPAYNVYTTWATVTLSKTFGRFNVVLRDGNKNDFLITRLPCFSFSPIVYGS